jgi:hypothetical protein
MTFHTNKIDFICIRSEIIMIKKNETEKHKDAEIKKEWGEKITIL